MDKGQQQNQVPQQMQPDKSSLTAKANSIHETSTTNSRVKSWAPHSKINRILCNIERSILNQFNNNHNGSSSGSSSSSSSSSLIKSKSQRLSANSIGPPSSIEVSLASLNPRQEPQTTDRDNKRNIAQKKSTSNSNGISLQLKSEPQTIVKTALNKYQQQIVSTMRPNHQHILNQSSNINKLNNKLSIPPPHANDEARNQNHRIIFGASAVPNDQTKQLSDTNAIHSSATLKPSTSGRLAPSAAAAKNDPSKLTNETQNNAEINFIRHNASPASSAKSLPTVATKPTGSQTFNKSINEDEESGFSTYQSRRSLLTASSTTSSQANGSTITASSANAGDENKAQNNKMILMQTQTQVPIGAFNFNKSSQQQMIYNYQYPHMKQSYQQQQNINTQNFFANNQVPITSTTVATTIDQSNKNCYPNHSSQQIQNHISNAQRLSQVQFSDQHLNDHQHAPFPPAPPHQLYNLYGPNSGPGLQVPVLHADTGQEIYANAPPKPRRYQYYNPSTSAHIFPQMIPTMTVAPPVMTSTSLSMANGNTSNAIIRHQQPMFNRQNYPQFNQQQQMPTNQSIYNMSYLKMPNLYPQQQGLPVQVSNQHQIPYNSANNHEQQRSVNLPNTLTKSKSSLDTCDLIQYKLDAQNRSNTLRIHPQRRHPPLQNQQQSIYGSQADDSSRHANTMQGHQQGIQHLGNSLHRSKSVSHLLQPDFERQQINHQRDLYIDNGHTTIGPKFLSVSSSSTTNMNMVGLANKQQIIHQNHFAKAPSQLNISHNQPPHQQYHDLVQQQGNQLFSSAAQRQHQYRLNSWHQQNHITSIRNESSNQRPKASDPINVTKINSAFSSCGKVVRHPHTLGEKLILEDGFGKPSLDDQIRYLMIGEDDSTNKTNNASISMVESSNQIDGNVIYHQSSNNGNMTQTAWVSKQQLSLPAESSVNGNTIFQRENRHNAYVPSHSPRVPNDINIHKNVGEIELTNRIYMDEIASKMGNRQHRQYQINDIKHLDSSPMKSLRNNESTDGGVKNTSNSQLIVDLTTPRVLAKTQTTLSSGDIHTDATQRRNSCSINQVGLPSQPINTTMSISQMEERSLNSSNSRAANQQVPVTGHFNDDEPIDNELTSTKPTFVHRVEKASVYERTAPYYYSDLKSEEQRQALLSIVQQKSLSPPPQLLSRSTDQSSTRLALKSATLHPAHMRMLGDSMAKDKRQGRDVNNSDLKYDPPSNIFNSTSNIAKNIDKLFESPAQPRINAVQSMLALNVKDIPQSSLLDFQATSESNSIGYFSSDLKNKNMSKSKSLENINHGSINENLTIATTLSKTGNPVYENIRRSDKLMSAINNSTTCLSTSGLRSKRQANYIVENQNINSEESTDSILGSSLDESDSSLDLIDEIKISPTDNHLSDISQLIDQLKINHSKLSDEYKSTLVRIARTMNAKNKHTNAGYQNDKLSRRLQLLELKSKKCESRSKNQLALIQMMEKVLKQSKARNTSSSIDSSVSSSIDLSKPSMSRNQLSTSPSLSFDYQNIKPQSMVSSIQTQATYASPTSSNSPPNMNSQRSVVTETNRNLQDEQPTLPSRLGQSVMRAIVTETVNPAEFVTKVKRTDETNGQVSLSTRHHQQSLQGANSKTVLRSSSASCDSIQPVEINKNRLRNSNPFSGDKEEDEDSASTSESSVEGNIAKLSKDHHGNQSTNSTSVSKNMRLDMTRDEEDFIEFMTTDTSNHHSQFGASQFSASDFDNQASTGDSRSANNSNISHLTKKHSFAKGAVNMGILKSAKNGHDCSNNINNNNNTTGGIKNNRNGFDNMKDGSSDRSKFNNVLGNVIDVDVCPMNNLSQNSPVNNQASCLN